MKEYKALHIVKHALAYYINREGATKDDTEQEKRLLAEVEDRIELLRERYGIPKKRAGKREVEI